MKILERYGFYLLIIAVISELVLPFVLGRYIKGYSQVEMLISNFGETGMPTKTAFKIWEIINGTLFVLAAPAFYAHFNQTSHSLSMWIAICIVIFGIGDCIITGLVDRASSADEVGFASMLHNFASGAGFLALLIGTFLLIWLFYLQQNNAMVITLIVIFLISGFFMLLFALPKIPFVNTFQISHRGLWQRLNLLFLYLPFFIVAVKNLPVFKNR
ncbi:hypothetical protein FC56_GL000855 [Lentilactobacillus senioris DSM 24302 = JCM 17472]|uniref:DUF998 domain-containing protein n=1 Tax=Lentilactobacillus senioris DSM 24302 = JCM 17472 TaxID=1423802 RepID=A0A0R2CZE5_9LACO|nr:DUF998 domain-containing protein [Lentilactobacillus senioris]KRM93190.1 hypothetical protein FC56_GL000855 [Lentilactobacillus senioris DSM 24302 = JCM 17472]